MGDKEKKIIINSFILCHFNYFPLIWMLCSKRNEDKLEKINERALRLAYSDHSFSYKELLANSKNLPSIQGRLHEEMEGGKICTKSQPKAPKKFQHSLKFNDLCTVGHKCIHM